MFFRETQLIKLCSMPKDAEQAQPHENKFIQNMSHEIRTPLNSIVGFSRILSSKISERRIEENIRDYHRARQ